MTRRAMLAAKAHPGIHDLPEAPERRPIIVLLDLGLPDADGVAAVSALCAGNHAPVIVYSGTRDPELRQQALMCGARHYLVKGSESAFSLRFMIQQVLARGNA